jgi:hypothetical protein
MPQPLVSAHIEHAGVSAFLAFVDGAAGLPQTISLKGMAD